MRWCQAAIADIEEREAMFQQMVDQLYERGEAVNAAAHFEIDAVTDTVESRRWILSAIEET